MSNFLGYSQRQFIAIETKALKDVMAYRSSKAMEALTATASTGLGTFQDFLEMLSITAPLYFTEPCPALYFKHLKARDSLTLNEMILLTIYNHSKRHSDPQIFIPRKKLLELLKNLHPEPMSLVSLSNALCRLKDFGLLESEGTENMRLRTKYRIKYE